MTDKQTRRATGSSIAICTLCVRCGPTNCDRASLVQFSCLFSHIFAARRSALGRLLLWQRVAAVCLSRWCVVPKPLSRSLCDLHQVVAQSFQFARTNMNQVARREPPSLRAPGGMAWVRNAENATRQNIIRNRTYGGRFVSDGWAWASCCTLVRITIQLFAR